MSKEYDILLKNISNSQLAIIHSKDLIIQKGSNISQYEKENLSVEAEQLQKLSKELFNLLNHF